MGALSESGVQASNVRGHPPGSSAFLHRADFARWDLAGAHSFSSLGTHSSAVGRGLVSHHTRTSGFDRAGLGDGGGFGLHFSAGALVWNWVANCEASASSAWAPKEAKAATAAMERKRAVLFMMDKSLKLKSVSKKPGQKPFLNRVR